MKEATGELNMTVVTLIAVAALGAVFYFAVWPLVQTMLMNNTCATYGVGYHAINVGENAEAASGSAKVYNWYCCQKGTDKYDEKKCIKANTGTPTNNEGGTNTQP